MATLPLPGAALRGESDCASSGAGLLVEAEPVPVMLTTCGLSPSLSQVNNCATSAPCTIGVKVMLMVQFAPGARLLGQLLVCWKSRVLVSPWPPLLPVSQIGRHAGIGIGERQRGRSHVGEGDGLRCADRADGLAGEGQSRRSQRYLRSRAGELKNVRAAAVAVSYRDRAKTRSAGRGREDGRNGAA